ncbi:hypothetical protein L6278_00825 [Candidatus Parcubacteria bacterium]|nr:hypothetical protein [Patescibacteria group bacterium]MBU4481931.1 hypothetical protein [Patescibacteria group bacterium]MCG2686663.1 hypothetical protein [Candidatus Parcubacteria bacterium]
MPYKITTPLIILTFTYLMIIGISVVVVGLAGLAVYDLNNYFTHREETAINKNCQKYFDKGDLNTYSNCCEQVIKSFE